MKVVLTCLLLGWGTSAEETEFNVEGLKDSYSKFGSEGETHQLTAKATLDLS